MTVSVSDAAHIGCVRCHEVFPKTFPLSRSDQPCLSGGTSVARAQDNHCPASASRASKVVRNEAHHDFSHVRVRAEVG
jgi:hypothetical protein